MANDVESKLNKKSSILSNTRKTNVFNITQLEELMMASKAQEDRLAFSWTAPKGLLTIGLFLALALVFEFFIVSFFTGSGLIEMSANPLAGTLLFNFLPLTVIIVLVSSWIYLTKHVAIGPRVTAPAKASKIHRSHPRRRKSRQTFTQTISGTIKKVFNKIADVFSRSSRVSVEQQQLTVNRAALESVVTVLAIFLLSAILLSVLVYPRLFTDFAAGFYSANPVFQAVAVQIIEALQGLAGVFAPIRALAPGVRSIFGGLVTARAQSFTSGDILFGYVLCQNAAAWISAFVALAYGKYITGTYRPVKR